MNKDEKESIMEYYKQKINNIYENTFETIKKIKDNIYNTIPGIAKMAHILNKTFVFSHFFH